MPRRWQEASRRQLSEPELAALRERLKGMPRHELEIFYKATHNACAYSVGKPPAPRAIQELVQAWKILHRLGKRRL